MLVVLNTDQVVKDLLDKRSNIYSSRPELYLANIVSGGMRIILLVVSSSLSHHVELTKQ